MKFVGLLAVLAIIYLLVSRQSRSGFATEAMKEADAVVATPRPQAAPPAPPAPATTGLRAPIDRTRGVLDQAKQRNSGGF
ncbi:MAG: hypothetical protein ABMA13_12135 [Chthoniobacteraceae bacterium]